jgi:hypothetical protein
MALCSAVLCCTVMQDCNAHIFPRPLTPSAQGIAEPIPPTLRKATSRSRAARRTDHHVLRKGRGLRAQRIFPSLQHHIICQLGKNTPLLCSVCSTCTALHRSTICILKPYCYSSVILHFCAHIVRQMQYCVVLCSAVSSHVEPCSNDAKARYRLDDATVYSTVLCCAALRVALAQDSTAQYSTAQLFQVCSQRSNVLYCTVVCSTEQYCAVLYSSNIMRLL